MKKIASLLFSGLLTVSLLSGCNTSSEEEKPTQNETSEVTSQSSKNEDERYKIYLLALEAGYDGTYEEWLESIKGAKGDKGDPGDKGADGTSLRTGEGAPDNSLGIDGDSYIDFSTWNFYVKENGVWVLKGNIKNETPPTYHTVNFDTQGGDQIPSQQVKHGEKITKPADPVKTGYDFESWLYQGESWSFIGYVVTEDITLVADFDVITYTIKFLDDNGDVIDSTFATYFEDFESKYSFPYYPICSSDAPTGKFYEFDKWNKSVDEEHRIITFTPTYILKDLVYGDYVKIDDEMYPLQRGGSISEYSASITLGDLKPGVQLEFYRDGNKLNLATFNIYDLSHIDPLDSDFKTRFPLKTLTLTIVMGETNTITIRDARSSAPDPIPGHTWHYIAGIEDWVFEDECELFFCISHYYGILNYKLDPDAPYICIADDFTDPYFYLYRTLKGTTMPSFDVWEDLPGKVTHYNQIFGDQSDMVWNVNNDDWHISAYNCSTASTVEDVYEIGEALPINSCTDITYRVNGYVIDFTDHVITLASKKASFVTSNEKTIKVPLHSYDTTYFAQDTYIQVTCFVHHNTNNQVEMLRVLDSTSYYAGIVVLEESSSVLLSSFGLSFADGRKVRTVAGDQKYIRMFEFDAGDRFKLRDFSNSAEWCIPLERISIHHSATMNNVTTSDLFEIDDGYIKVRSSFIGTMYLTLQQDNDSLGFYVW